MRPLVVSFAAMTVALGLASGAALAQHDEHHPDGSTEPTDSTQSAPQGGGQDEGGGMMGMHGGGMGKMHDHMRKMHGRHHGPAPSVVINIYPGGGMGMMGQGGMMSGGGMGMMGQGGMMSGGGMGMMGQGGMMSGDGMGMMGQGGMMRGGGMMMDRGQAPDQKITVDQAREHMTAMMQRMGGDLALGEVKELDQDLIDAELTDPSGSEAGRMIMNRHSGAMMRVR